MGPIELQIIAIVTLFLVGILTIKDTRVRDILTVVPIGVIMMLLLKDSQKSFPFLSNTQMTPDPLTMAMTEYFQSQVRQNSQSSFQNQHSQPHQQSSQEQFMSPSSSSIPASHRIGHPILGPIEDLHSDPLFPSIASHIQTKVFLIKSPSSISSSSSTALTPYNSRNSMEPFLQSSSFGYQNDIVGSGMGLSTFFQNSNMTTPGTIWGGNEGIILNTPPKQMLHDPKLTSLISTMVMRYPHRKNDLLEVSRRYHNEVLGNI
jgi:hypothetical protein